MQFNKTYYLFKSLATFFECLFAYIIKSIGISIIDNALSLKDFDKEGISELILNIIFHFFLI